MPIQFQVTSASQVEQEIRSFEAEYGFSSDEFLQNPTDDVVSEFDAIEWNFLLMQRETVRENGCNPTAVFRGDYRTQTSVVDPRDMYESVAA
jgi:hypothetical protein